MVSNLNSGTKVPCCAISAYCRIHDNFSFWLSLVRYSRRNCINNIIYLYKVHSYKIDKYIILFIEYNTVLIFNIKYYCIYDVQFSHKTLSWRQSGIASLLIKVKFYLWFIFQNNLMR